MLNLCIVLIMFTTYVVYGQLISDYELEFLDSSIYTPCKNYPDNFVDQLFDMSNLHIDQTEDGSIILKGPTFMKINVKPTQPIWVEVYKKERGEWQQTQFTQKHDDFCTACFDEKQFWHEYLKNTPKEQLKCPFYEGQKVDLDITEPTKITTSLRNVEGDYNFHVEVGNRSGDFFICADIFATVYKV